MAATLTVVDHPLVQHKLTLMRRIETSTADFRRLLWEIGMLLGYETLRDLPLHDVPIETPVTTMEAPQLACKKLCLVPVWRAGDGLLRPMLDLVPSARVGHIGMERDEETLEPRPYFFRVPKDLENRITVVLDPMLATGGSASDAISQIKKVGAKDIRFMSLVAAPEGVDRLQKDHSDVPIFTGALDSHLNEKGYIVPGLGDAGDRLFGTKGL